MFDFCFTSFTHVPLYFGQVIQEAKHAHQNIALTVTTCLFCLVFRIIIMLKYDKIKTEIISFNCLHDPILKNAKIHLEVCVFFPSILYM